MQADTHCMLYFNLIVLTWVSSTVLYGCHSLVSALVCYKAHYSRQLAKQLGAL